MAEVHVDSGSSKRFSGMRSLAKSFSSSIRGQNQPQGQGQEQSELPSQLPTQIPGEVNQVPNQISGQDQNSLHHDIHISPNDGTITPSNQSSTSTSSSRNSLSGPSSSRYYNKSLIHQQIVDNETLAEANVKLEQFSPIGSGSGYGLSSLPTPPPTHLNGYQAGNETGTSLISNPTSANIPPNNDSSSTFDISEHIRMELFDDDGFTHPSESFYTSPQDGSGTSPSSSGNSPQSHHGGDEYKKVWIAPGSMELDSNHFLNSGVVAEDSVPGILIPSSDFISSKEPDFVSQQLVRDVNGSTSASTTTITNFLKSEPQSSVSSPFQKHPYIKTESPSYSPSSSSDQNGRTNTTTTTNTTTNSAENSTTNIPEDSLPPAPKYFPDFDPNDWNDTSNLKYNLRVSELPAKSRVETQIKLVLNFFPPPPQTSLHLASDTISKPKLQLKTPFEASPSTLHLETIVVCHSNVHRYANMCNGCIRRERKRASRKKVSLPVEEAHWCEDSEKRGIVFNCKEVVEFGALNDIELNGKMIQSRQIELPMRLACYCRHHGEKVGFR